ncbi:MerR family transcriptional regulator [Streptomyces tanashiensis]|uniref:MerR family transcriptional regulator n=1 Tax=Streptomyces tanashiensis TaxID=67367 RepID=UPI00167ECEA0|nr:MerR family transcriptional regulator [Streptomyces tanashiensis]GGY12135.1 MerR family transcriptional regulator [Streptomyces tanashiensis]
MRIGEIAALVGVTPRAVRHYHQSGLLPEPARRANGYREYGVRDAVLLARIRRLTELGLGLDEVRDVLAGDEGRGLVEVLEELEADLARQEAVIRERRERLARLLAEARAGRLPAEGPVSPELAALLAGLGELPESPMAAKDREILALLDAVAPEDERARLMELMRDVAGSARELYGLLDALADAAPDDPRVEEAARALAAVLPDGIAVELPPEGAGGLADTFFADLAPAQSTAVRRAVDLVAARRAEDGAAAEDGTERGEADR